jgi:uncharacterized membrane protein YqhA
MLRFALSLRFLMLFAAFGALLGALVMFWEGGAKLLGGIRNLFSPDENGRAVIGSVMGATDSFLFALVLMIFAFAITFGFVLDLSEEDRARLPAWMRVQGVGELKHTLIEVILLYLVVDFATDVAEGTAHLAWETLVMPISIVLVAGALRLMSTGPETPSLEHGSARSPAEPAQRLTDGRGGR